MLEQLILRKIQGGQIHQKAILTIFGKITDNLSPHDQHKLRIEDIVGMRMRSNRKYTIKIVCMYVMVVSGVCVTSVKLSVH